MNTARTQKLDKEPIEQLLDAVKFAGIDTLKHMTHINNLEQILEHGLQCHGNPFQKEDISNQSVNDRRVVRDPIFNRSLHDYVPFYFNPRNAMLYKAQNEHFDCIVILGYSSDLLLQNEALITNANAACGGTSYSSSFQYLYQLDWTRVFSRSWYQCGQYDHARKRAMMAEALIPSRQGIGNQYLRTIYCATERIKRVLENRFSLGHIDVVCKPSVFF